MTIAIDFPTPSPWPATFPLQPGIYEQLYLASTRGGELVLNEVLNKHVQRNKENQEFFVRPVAHVSPRYGERHANRISTVFRQHGFDPAFAFGLDGKQDIDGTLLTAREKGQCMVRVLKDTKSYLGLVDMEGAWDVDTGPQDETDESGAVVMLGYVRSALPNIVLMDQSWFAIMSHGDNRRTIKPIGEGGSFAGFPRDEIAKFVNASAPQPYWCNFRRLRPRDAAKYVFHRMEREHKEFETHLAKLDPKLVIPRTITIQSYGHERNPGELVSVLLAYADRPIVMWRDFRFATGYAFTLRCIKAAQKIKAAGFTGLEAVKKFKQSLNGALPVNDDCDTATLQYLGA